MWSGLSVSISTDIARSGPNLGTNIGSAYFCVSPCSLSIHARDIDSLKSDVFDVILWSMQVIRQNDRRTVNPTATIIFTRRAPEKNIRGTERNPEWDGFSGLHVSAHWDGETRRRVLQVPAPVWWALAGKSTWTSLASTSNPCLEGLRSLEMAGDMTITWALCSLVTRVGRIRGNGSAESMREGVMV